MGQIDVRNGGEERQWGGLLMHSKVAVSGPASIIYPPLPTIKPVMSWFNSLGKQAYSSHVSINVNYPGSWSHLRVPQHCSLGLIAPAWNPIC